MIARLTRRKGASLILMVMIYAVAFPMHVLAMPQGGHVVAGEANISLANPQTMNIQQGTPSAILNWQQFSIGQPEAVHFMQPSAAAVSLNRVVGVDPSAIHGLLSANGRVFLINPNGVLVGPTGRIETGGFVASTLDMANQDFLNGNYTFVQDPAQPLGAILNQGLIQASQGGNVSLIAPAVENQGTILANLGTVSLGAGEQVTLAFAGNDMIRFAVDAPVTGQVIGPDGTPLEHTLLNSGTISADGGEVILSARSAFDAVKSVVNNTGVIEAKTIADNNGIIRLEGGEQGIVFNSGTLDVSGTDPGETAGEVRVTGEKVGLVHYSEILAKGRQGGGKVLVGGDFQGKNPDVPNAKRTYVGSDSVINADAIESGDGGRVIVWSDEVTRFYGDVSARGGVERGDGGFVEVSGKQNLAFHGQVDLDAEGGETGTLLLDPANIVIRGGLLNDGDDDNDATATVFDHQTDTADGTTVNFDDTFTNDFGSAADFDIFESEIEGTNANFILRATNSISVAGTFDNNSGNPGDTVNGTLALQSGNSLTLETRNNGAAEAGSINLTGSAHTTSLAIVTSGAGTITINSGVGGNQNTDITLPVLTSASAIIIGAGGGTSSVTLNGDINAGSLDIDATGTIGINNTIGTTGTVDIDSGGVTTVAGAGDITAGGAVTFGATLAGALTTSGDIDTTDDNVTFTRAVTLAGNVDIDTGGTTAGNILFSSTVATGGNDLSLDAGPAGNITVSDALSGGGDLTVRDGAVQSYAALTVNALDIQDATTSVTFNNDVTSATTIDVVSGGSIVQTGNVTGATGLAYDAGSSITQDGSIAGVATVDFDAVTTIGINNTIGTTGTVDIDSGGVTTVAGAGDITAGGAVTFGATLAGALTTSGDIGTTDDNVTFTRAVTLAGSVDIDTGLGIGSIAFNSTLDGTTAFTEALQLTAGSGNVVFSGAVGSVVNQALGAITIVSGAEVTAQSTIEASSLVQSAGSGTTRLQDNVTTTAAAGVNLTATAIALDGLTIAASGDGVARFNGATVLEGATTVTTTGTGAITFESTVDSVASAGHTLALTGDSGDIVLNGAVGSGVNQELGSFTVNSAANVTSTDEVHTINALTLRNIGGTADFSDEVTATSLIVENTVANVNMTGNGNFIVNAVDFLNTGDLTLGQAGGLQTYAGGLDSTGVGGTVSIAGAIATTNTNLSLPNVTLISNATLDAGSDDISLGDVIIENNATLNLGAGGSGNVSVQSISGEPLGGTTSSVNFNVTGVVGVTNGIGSEIDSVTITQSGGTTFGNTVDANTIALTDTTGTISFQGALTAGTLTTASQAYNVEINAGATITNPVTFLNTGTLTLGNEVGDNMAFTGGVIATASSSKSIAGTITAAGTGVIDLGSSDTNVTTTTRVGGVSTGQITFGDVTMADGVVLTLGDGAATPINTGAVSGTASGAGSSLTINSGGAVVIGGPVSTDIDDVTVTDSGGVVFSGAVGGVGDRIDDIALVDTTGTIEFQDDLYAGDLSAAGSGFGVSFLGGTTDIADQVTLSNTGQVTFGDGGSLTFTGGVTHTAGSNVINGDIRSVNSNIDLDSATTVTGSSQVTAGNGTITLGDTVLSDGVTLTLGDGVGSGDVSVDSLAGTPGAPASDVVFNVGGTADVLGTVGTDIGTLTVSGSGGATFADAVTVSSLDLTATGGALRFQGDVAAATLNTAGNPFNLEFDEDLTVTNAVAFGAFGDLTIGSAGDDVALFNGGVGTQAVTGTVTVAGAVRTSGDPADLGAVTLSDGTVLDTTNNGAAATGADLTVGQVTGGSNALALNSGDNGQLDVTGSVSGVTTLDITDSNGARFRDAVSAGTLNVVDTTGTVVFDGALTLTTLTTSAGGYAMVFNEGGTVTSDTTFANTGGVTFGNEDTDSITFSGGLDTTAGSTAARGTIQTSNTQMDLGALALNGNTTLVSGFAPTSVINVGAVTGNTHNLTLDAGFNPSAGITVASVGNVGTFTINDSGFTTISGTTSATTVTLTDTTGAVTFDGAVNINTLNTTTQPYSVVFNEGGTVNNDTTFANTGGRRSAIRIPTVLILSADWIPETAPHRPQGRSIPTMRPWTSAPCRWPTTRYSIPAAAILASMRSPATGTI